MPKHSYHITTRTIFEVLETIAILGIWEHHIGIHIEILAVSGNAPCFQVC